MRTPVALPHVIALATSLRLLAGYDDYVKAYPTSPFTIESTNKHRLDRVYMRNKYSRILPLVGTVPEMRIHMSELCPKEYVAVKPEMVPHALGFRSSPCIFEVDLVLTCARTGRLEPLHRLSLQARLNST